MTPHQVLPIKAKTFKVDLTGEKAMPSGKNKVAPMGSGPRNVVLPTVDPLLSVDDSDLPLSIRLNIEAIGSIVDLQKQVMSLTEKTYVGEEGFTSFNLSK
ncbi:hypothetical protein Tco_0340745 [Tanacetum coccineum]